MTFHLQAGTKFHDDTDCDATAVKASIDRVMDPNVNSPQAGQLANIASVDVVDAATVKITQKTPGRPLLASLGERPGFIVSRPQSRNMGRISRRIPLDLALSNSSNGFQTATSKWRDSTDTGIPANRILIALRFGTYLTRKSRQRWSEPVKHMSSTLFRRHCCKC